MADELWYFAKAGKQLGPVDLATLQSMAGSRELLPNDLVWTEGMANWQPAGGLAPIFPLNAPVNAPATGPASGGFAPPPAGPFPTPYYNPRHHQRPVEYAGFWIRFGAAIIDGILVNIAGVIVGFIAGFFIGFSMGASGASNSEIETAAGIVGNVIGILIAWLYEALMTSSPTQATLGKMAVGVKVTDLSGNRINFARATGRYFAKILSAIILLIGYIMAAFTERKQALHDMMAGTLVVRK
jgi:uncharacterized RDD family membrane protein YckC